MAYIPFYKIVNRNLEVSGNSLNLFCCHPDTPGRSRAALAAPRAAKAQALFIPGLDNV